MCHPGLGTISTVGIDNMSRLLKLAAFQKVSPLYFYNENFVQCSALVHTLTIVKNKWRKLSQNDSKYAASIADPSVVF